VGFFVEVSEIDKQEGLNARVEVTVWAVGGK